MSIPRSPIVSEFETEEQAASYDRWFRARCRLQLTILVLVFRTIRRWLKSRRCWKRGARLVLLVKWRPEAIVALIEIIDYIEQYNPVAAVSLH